MKFEDLRYVERIDRCGKALCLPLPGGFPVFKSTVELAWTSVHGNWASIDWTRRQSAQTMIGGGVWQTQVVGAKRALGRAIRFFVKHDMLPLRLVLARTLKGTRYKGGKRLYMPAHTVNTDVVPVMEVSATRIAHNREFLAHVDWAALAQPAPQLGAAAMSENQLIYTITKERYRAAG